MAEYGTAKKIAYYITAHGFGHAVRSMEIIRALLERDDRLDIVLISDLPDFLVTQYLDSMVRVRKKRLDVGLVQQDSLQFDLEATLQALESLHRQREALVAEEIRFLEQERIVAVVSDISFLPFPAAARCGIPAVGVGNFTWDWIYQAYEATDFRWLPLLDWIRAAYADCNRFLQLPMHGDCSSCSPIIDVPLVTRKAHRTPRQTRRSLGCTAEQKLYLIAFADLDLDPLALARLEQLQDAVLLYKHPLHYRLPNAIALDDYDFLTYPDVVAAVDGVITKPGYGIVADCLAHGTPMIYTDRGFFPEYEILVRNMERHLTTVYLPSEALYSGRWEPAVSQLAGLARRFPKLRDDGAAVCAEMILELASQPTRSV